MHMTTPNRLSPLRFVVAFGVVSMLADFVYEGARAIIGPYLATLGASAGLIGLITGFGEAVAYIARLASGPVSDRTGKHWTLSIAVRDNDHFCSTPRSYPYVVADGPADRLRTVREGSPNAGARYDARASFVAIGAQHGVRTA